MPASRCERTPPGAASCQDQELIEAWERGDDDAFGLLVRLHSSALVTAVRRFTGPELAEEVVQETWMVVVAKICRLRHRGDFQGWLLAIGRNLAKRRAHRESREHAVGKAPVSLRVSLLQQEDWIQGSASDAPDPCRQALAREQLARTRLALQRLSNRDRAALRQAALGSGLATPAAAGASAVRVSRFRARRRLLRDLGA